MPTVRRAWHIHALVILTYTLLALGLTWPLAAHLSTHVPGNGVDDPPLTWNLWWVQHSLLDLGNNPFDGNYLFYPLGINLAFYTLTVLNGLLSIPLQAVLGLVSASNLLLLSSFALSGYGAFLLASYLLGASSKQQATRDKALQPSDQALRSNDKGVSGTKTLAAFVAGLVYAFASSKLTYASLGQWNIASSQWIPFYVLYLFKLGDHPRQWRCALMAALFLLLQAYAELTYATFLVLFTALWMVWQFVIYARDLKSARLWRSLAAVILVMVLFALGLVPMLAKMIPDMLLEGDFFVEGSGFAEVFSSDLLGFLVPTMQHPLFGSLVERFNFHHGVGQHIYLGYSALAVAITGIVYWSRRARQTTDPGDKNLSAQQAGGSGATPVETTYPQDITFWSLSAILFWLLTLGPTLQINGHNTGLPLPFALVAQLPFFKGNRYPSRYSVLLVLSLAILVAFGLAAFYQTRPVPSSRQAERSSSRLRPGVGTWLPVLVLLIPLLLFEYLSVPLPLSDMGVPVIYRTIAAEMPADFTLLDLPVAWRNGFRVTGTQHPTIMFQQYYQATHGKPLLAGNTSRNPPLKFQYFVEAPVINTLIALETGHRVDPAIIEQDRALAADVLRFFGIEAIVVHPAHTGPDMVPYLEASMPVEKFYADQELIAYRVDLPPRPEAWTVKPGDALSRLSYAEGWGVPVDDVVWAQRRAARLLVPLNGKEQKMAFRAYTPDGGQQLRLEINGHTVHSIGMAAGWMDYELTLPIETVYTGMNEVWLHFDTLYPAGEVQLSSRLIGQTGVESPVNFVVQSAGQEVGDFGHIYINGRDVSPGERGYNVAVVHPQTGRLERVAAFDTHLDERASQALADFLGDVAPGWIVAVAAADEASRLLGQEAVDALRGIGAAQDLRDKFRWGHAIVGVQGAPAGTAAEAADWMRPVTVTSGEGATEPDLAAAFGTITFSALSGQ